MSQGKPISGIGLAVLGAMLAMLLAVPAAVAQGGNTRPLAIQSASLKEEGQDLVWYVRLDRGFSPTSLARDHVSLCLLLERASNGQFQGEVCVAPGRHRRPPAKVVFMWAPGHGRAIDATITRVNSESMQASFLPLSVELHYRPLRWQVQSSVAAPACAPPTEAATNPCVTLSPAHPTLLRLHVPKLVGCVAKGPTWVFHGSSKVRDIALAFDDGPWVDTPQFLSVLEREHAPATFFEIGDQIGEYGQGGAIERRMLRDGDMIGDHTWSHQDVAGAGSFARSQIVMAADAIRQTTHGFYPCLFRAPYGDVSPALLAEVRSLGMTTIQWDIDPRDWSLPGVGEIESNVIDNAHNGAILEMHDGGGPRYETIAALPTIINTLRKRGYKFVTITQMLGYRLIYK